MANTLGHLFRITTWGESHGGGVGVVIDGCPPLLDIDEREIQTELDRRRPGAGGAVSARNESDTLRILSGVREGKSLGTPILLLVENVDARPEDYEDLRDVYRPSHADFTYEAKYGIRDWRGGGRASARETVGRVAAGAVARKVIESAGIRVIAYVRSLHDVEAKIDPERVRAPEVERSPLRCPDPEAERRMQVLLEEIKESGDSLGGVIECAARNVPPGLGEPVFDKLDADLAKALLSIPAVKGFEIGSGFAASRLKGSEHNDQFELRDGRIRTATNRSGGVQGGISNGENIVLRVAFKPTATIAKMQKTVSRNGNITEIRPRGRHDPCVLPRAVPVVEAMVALVLADHLLRQKALRG
ncbi:MAG: chorismate synthase [Candidatus Eisenbacteria bacterium]|nr:chorismate synthase [Candidatus Eisenbacteria bacterium]